MDMLSKLIGRILAGNGKNAKITHTPNTSVIVGENGTGLALKSLKGSFHNFLLLTHARQDIGLPHDKCADLRYPIFRMTFSHPENGPLPESDYRLPYSTFASDVA